MFLSAITTFDLERFSRDSFRDFLDPRLSSSASRRLEAALPLAPLALTILTIVRHKLNDDFALLEGSSLVAFTDAFNVHRVSAVLLQSLHVLASSLSIKTKRFNNTADVRR